MTTAQRRLGSLHFAAVQPDAYSEEEVQFLSCVAEHVAVAVDNALRHTALQREQERLRLLFELTNQVIAHVELREVLRHDDTHAARHARGCRRRGGARGRQWPVARRGPGRPWGRGGSRRRP